MCKIRLNKYLIKLKSFSKQTLIFFIKILFNIKMKRTLKKKKSESSIDDNQSSSNTCSRRKQRQRLENSLGELTKNVIKYIKKSGEKEIQINNLVTDLGVKKRRIYDITNVLEGNKSKNYFLNIYLFF